LFRFENCKLRGMRKKMNLKLFDANQYMKEHHSQNYDAPLAFWIVTIITRRAKTPRRFK
jgi:hypothetical protein